MNDECFSFKTSIVICLLFFQRSYQTKKKVTVIEKVKETVKGLTSKISCGDFVFNIECQIERQRVLTSVHCLSLI